MNTDTLASIQRVKLVEKHSNADKLDIVTILNGYKCIVLRDSFKVDDLCVFVMPDSILPETPWTEFYKSKSSRVRAIKLRGQYSFGIVESIPKLLGDNYVPVEGEDITEKLGITKYTPPEPQDLSARRLLPYGIPKTDEDRFQSLDVIPYGEIGDITLKLDGQSWSAYVKLENGIVTDKGLLGRTMEYKVDSQNKYAQNDKQYSVLAKLEVFCLKHNVSLCIRGESHGMGIQNFAHNPSAKLPLSLALFSTYLIDEGCYARKGHKFYIFDIASEIGIPTVPIVEKDVVITPELIQKYDEGISEIDGKPFEGVVIQWKGGSFKVISKSYDSKK